MFRGNRPLRPIRRALRNALGVPFAPIVRRQIFEANQLLQSGQYVQAGDAFSGLASQAKENGHPRRAANLNTQAAHAYIDGKNENLALTQSRSALTLFQQLGMVDRAAQFWRNIQNHLQRAGMSSALASLRQEFGSKIDLTPLQKPVAPSPAKQGHLPAQCPGCGAPVRTDEVEWVDEQSAECPFCGSILISE